MPLMRLGKPKGTPCPSGTLSLDRYQIKKKGGSAHSTTGMTTFPEKEITQFKTNQDIFFNTFSMK